MSFLLFRSFMRGGNMSKVNIDRDFFGTENFGYVQITSKFPHFWRFVHMLGDKLICLWRLQIFCWHICYCKELHHIHIKIIEKLCLQTLTYKNLKTQEVIKKWYVLWEGCRLLSEFQSLVFMFLSASTVKTEHSLPSAAHYTKKLHQP